MIWLVAGMLVVLARPLLTRPASAAVGQRIVGHLYEIVVYRDVPSQIGRVLLRICGESARLARSLLMPCLILLIPTGLALAVLSRSQSVRPLHVGETTILTLSLKQPAGNVTLELPPEVAQESSPLEVPDRLQVVWRLKVVENGRFQLWLRRSQDDAVSRSIRVNDSSWGLQDLVEGGVSSSWAREVTIDYPHREFWIGNHEVGWPGVFILALLSWGMALEVFLHLKHP